MLLFDVDQTLISTGGAGIRALNRAFQKLYAVENAMEGILPHGKTDPGIIREILHSHPVPSLNDGFPTSMTAILESYLEFLDNEIDSTSSYKILPGIEGILNSLSGRSDIAIGLATGNVEAGLVLNLSAETSTDTFRSEDSVRILKTARSSCVMAPREPQHTWDTGPMPAMCL